MPSIYRTIVYIDGFNLYYGIKRMYQSVQTPYRADRWREVLWLDLDQLACSLLIPSQELIAVKYFTARIVKPEEKRERQSDYLDVLATFPRVQIIEGEYQYKEKECIHCHKMFPNPKEKQSDVNFATEFIVDALEGNFDTAILIAADGDYKAPIQYVRKKFPEKRIIVEFIETNFSYVLSQSAEKTFIIKRDRLIRCQLPDIVRLPSGYQIKRPISWA